MLRQPPWDRGGVSVDHVDDLIGMHLLQSMAAGAPAHQFATDRNVAVPPRSWRRRPRTRYGDEDEVLHRRDRLDRLAMGLD